MKHTKSLEMQKRAMARIPGMTQLLLQETGHVRSGCVAGLFQQGPGCRGLGSRREPSASTSASPGSARMYSDMPIRKWTMPSGGPSRTAAAVRSTVRRRSNLRTCCVKHTPGRKKSVTRGQEARRWPSRCASPGRPRAGTLSPFADTMVGTIGISQPIWERKMPSGSTCFPAWTLPAFPAACAGRPSRSATITWRNSTQSLTQTASPLPPSSWNPYAISSRSLAFSKGCGHGPTAPEPFSSSTRYPRHSE